MHNTDKRKIQYVIPHRVCFTFERDGQGGPVNFDLLNTWTNGQGSDLQFSPEDNAQYEFFDPIFPAGNGSTKGATLTYLFATARPKEDAKDFPTPERSMQQVWMLDENCAREPVRIGEHVLRGVSVNWLSSATQSLIGGGGPGGEPHHGTPPARQGKHEFTLSSGHPRGTGKDVRVYILDTSPTLHDIAAAVVESQTAAINPLLDSLMVPGRLTVHPADLATLTRLMDYQLARYRFQIPDHGLFIAGIIHAIAEDARLHLVEVLSPYGIGDLESIVAGFYKAYVSSDKRFSGMILNCSFMLNAPLGTGDSNPNRKHKIVGHASPDLSLVVPKKRAAESLEPLCDLIKRNGGQVFAAAGNDRDPSATITDRPTARFPAAHDSVVGTGALPIEPYNSGSGYKSAKYSNFSDNPAKVGISTIGGEDGPDDGVQGLFIGTLPHNGGHGKDTKFWASWAGTSFATPVVAGFVAAEFSSGGHTSIRAALDTLLAAQAGATTEDQEPVLLVKQA